MSLTAKDVEEIIRLLEASNFSHMRLNVEGMKIEIARGAAPPRREREPAEASAAAAETPTPAAQPSPPTNIPDGLVAVRSPLLGIFYRSPKPGASPFVDVGSRVEEETVVGIIEVMKLMNSARAGVGGEVVKVLVGNGEPVEQDQPLLLVRPDAG